MIIAGQSASVGVTFLEKIFKKIENANYEKIIEILCFENVETLSNALNERDDIDIAIVSNFDYKQLYFYGSIRDFDFFDKTKLEVFKNKFQGWFLNLCKIDNELYGLPFAYSLPTVWKLEGTNRTDLVHNDKWIWENIRDNKEMCKIAEIYGIDKTPPFLLQKLSQIDKTNYFNFFCDSEFERTCKEWCEIVRKEKKQKSGELNEVTAFAGDPKGLRAMIKLPYFSKVSAGVESLFIAVPQKASITDISMFIDEYYSPEILLSDPVASKDLPILLNYEEYKGKGLTYFTEDEWQYYQTFYVDSYPRNQLIPIEAALANEMKCYMRKEQSFEEMIDKMNEIIIKHMHTYGLLRNGGGKL